MRSSDFAALLKEDLLRPDAYASIQTSTVILRETHISWVFLLDRDVFKLKKPVQLGFLDFRTLEQRKSACEAELRLNARLAPQVYLETVPVRVGATGRLCIGGAGTLVDWAVHMARLPDDARADQLLARNTLSLGAIDHVAKRIAEFHRFALSDPAIAHFGEVSVIARNMEENFEQSRKTIGAYLKQAEVEELIGWQRAFLRDHSTRFEHRVSAGRVRDGHGDLRLEHVYLLPDDTVTIIDCIEFNDRFRFADVCADIAFLSMDLADHRRVDLGEYLLAAYAREADDFDLYAVVDFYQSYRAFVRGKIAALLADDITLDSDTRDKSDKEARRYFLLALSAARKSLSPPTVVAVGGLIGSGKSTIASRVGAEICAPVVSADRTRKAMLNIEPTRRLNEPLWSGAYDPKLSEAVYTELLRRASVVLASGRSVVLDASFRSTAMRRAARELATKHGASFLFVECRAPIEVCRERLAKRERTAEVSDGRIAIFDGFRASFEPITELAPPEHIVLDTTRPIEQSLEVLRETISAWPEGCGG